MKMKGCGSGSFCWKSTYVKSTGNEARRARQIWKNRLDLIACEKKRTCRSSCTMPASLPVRPPPEQAVMSEAFSDLSRTILNLAHHEAIRLDHAQVGPAHLLLALLRE